MTINKSKIHEITKLISDWLKSETGKGPNEIKAYSIPGRIIIEINGYLTTIEKSISISLVGIKEILLGREFLIEKISKNIGSWNNTLEIKINNLLAAWSIQQDQAFIILVLEDNLKGTNQFNELI